MRIVAVKSWLLAALSLGRPAASQAAIQHGDVVTFDPYQGFTDQITTEKKQAVISPPNVNAVFKWNIIGTDDVKIKAVTLYFTPTKADLTTNPKPLGSGYPAIDGTLVLSVRDERIPSKTADISDPLASSIDLIVTSNSTEGTVKIKNIWNLIDPPTAATGKLLYFEAAWMTDGKTGKSYSRFFKVLNNEDQRLAALEDPVLQNATSVLPEEVGQDSSGTTGTSKPIGPTSTNSGATLATPTNSSGEIISTEKPLSSKSKKGLSIGAIVGIAIACGLLGLALIGGIVFFCLRRRQKQNALGSGTSRGVPYGGFASGGGRNGGDELMAEKEANAGVIHDVTNAPHSPYSDDGHNHQQHPMGMGGAGANNRNSGSVVIPNIIGSGVSPHVVLPGVDGRLEGDGGSPVSNAPSHHMQQQQIQHDHQSGRSYTMYTDHQSGGGGGGSPTTLHSGGGAPSLTHGGAGTESNRGSLISQQQQGRSLSTPYAHLVEEGMTEEEIRRLEEEERQLDAAIEQHAGGRRGSRNL
ncbi:hypothetical protein B0H65DRAFT_646 [Neurospora tetraspora]|uniref:Mid2 domain-containing protein n=1 Tax=Neurospora tetraspora TaxID=94610 RepID=A0AAE0MV57_9PEZI|nr:hypothetical protein B0H65DRAFT_646 [Neurospora tetraspora]